MLANFVKKSEIVIVKERRATWHLYPCFPEIFILKDSLWNPQIMFRVWKTRCIYVICLNLCILGEDGYVSLIGFLAISSIYSNEGFRIYVDMDVITPLLYWHLRWDVNEHIIEINLNIQIEEKFQELNLTDFKLCFELLFVRNERPSI